MKTKKSTRILSLLLSVVMVLLMLPFSGISVFAQSDNGEELTEWVGAGFDARKSNLSEPSFTQGKIIDGANSQTQLTPNSESMYLSASTLLEITNKYSENLDVSVGLDIPISKVNLGVDAKFSKESSTSVTTKKSELFEIYTVSDIRQTISIEGYDGDVNSLTLNSSFLNKISALEDAINKNDMSSANRIIDQLFDYYGTHLVTSYYRGGRLEATNHITSKDVLTENQLKESSQLKVDVGAGKVFNLSTEINMTSDNNSIQGENNTNHHMKIRDRGGLYPSMTVLSDPNYKSWRESLNEPKNLAIIGFVNDNSLVGIWELIDNTTIATAVKSRYLSSVQGYYYQTFVETKTFDVLNSTISMDYNYLSYVRIDGDEKSRYIAPGSTVYLDIVNSFDENLIYHIYDGSAYASMKEAEGIFTVNQNTADGAVITVTVITESGLHVCDISFTVMKSAFSGGYGTEARPFLLSTPEDIVNLANNMNNHSAENEYHYKLINSIDMDDNNVFGGIKGDFYGTLDGNGFCIYDFNINGYTEENCTAFVGFVHSNYGTIKNLTIGMSNLEDFKYNGYSAKIYSNRTETVDHEQYYSYIGGLVGYNKGSVINCKIENVYIEGILKDDNNEEKAFCNIGGLIGLNNGVINFCSAENICIKGNMDTNNNSGDDNYLKIGGLIGIQENNDNTRVINSIVRKINIDGCVKVSGKKDDGAYGELLIGGIVGHNFATIDSCISYDLKITRDISSGNYISNCGQYGGIVGDNSGNTNNCYTTYEEDWADGSLENSSSCLKSDKDTIVSLFKDIFAVTADNYMEINDVSACSVDTSVLKAFVEGDTFNPCGLKFNVTYKNGTQVLNAYESFMLVTLTSQSTLVRGNNEINTITYGGKSANITVQASCAHKNTIEIPGTPATCTSIGYTTSIYCTDCRLYIYERQEIPMLSEHIWGNGVITTPATHTKEGVKTYTCVCGETKTEAVPKLTEHNWGDGAITTPATHTKEGVKTYTCVCGETKTEAVPKLTEHNWGDGAITTPATHTKEGVKTYTCVCGETKTEAVPKLTEHNWGDGAITTPATHTKEGVKTYTCVCGETKTEAVPKLTEHSWGDGAITTPATHTKEGVKTYTCVCGETKTEAVPKLTEHSWGDGAITTPATHTKEGVKTYTCVCGETKTEAIPVLDKENADDGDSIEDTSSAISDFVEDTNDADESTAESVDKTNGCQGTVTSLSVIMIIAVLVPIVFVCIKKKEEF